MLSIETSRRRRNLSRVDGVELLFLVRDFPTHKLSSAAMTAA